MGIFQVIHKQGMDKMAEALRSGQNLEPERELLRPVFD